MNMSDAEAKKRILYVDDDREDMVPAHNELEKRDLQVDLAHTRKSAEELLAQNRYDSVLLDLKLPLTQEDEPLRDPARAEHGLHILRSLLDGAFEAGGTPHTIPVFIVTAFGSELQILEEVRRRGIKQIFTKPIQAIFLAETIYLALKKHERTQQ